MGTKRRSLSERFWEKVDKRGPSECWPWVAGMNRYGYGRVAAGGAKRAPILIASRVSWELHNGPIPAGARILHHCDNPRCVNPAHLYAGTQADNVRDMFQRGRANRPRGAAVWCARLTSAQAREIRAAYALGDISQRALGAQYGVSDVTVSRIVRGLRWSHA